MLRLPHVPKASGRYISMVARSKGLVILVHVRLKLLLLCQSWGPSEAMSGSNVIGALTVLVVCVVPQTSNGPWSA